MIGYYFYGRDPVKGYCSFNRQYAGQDESSWLIRMTGYEMCENAEAGRLPEKLFYFHFNSSRGRTGVYGKTSYNTPQESPMSGERNTVFSHQYLFEGEDRQNLLKRPEKLFEAGPFCTRMEDIYQLGNTPSGQRSYQYAYDDSRQDVFRGPCRAEYCPPAERTGLLEYFGLTGQKLAEFLYAAFAPGWTAYILLPENHEDATSKALVLMRSVLALFPKALLEYTGFLTYAAAVNDGTPAHYIPQEIKYVFLARTQKNIQTCRKLAGQNKTAVFGLEEPSGLAVPDCMRELMETLSRWLVTDSLEGEGAGLVPLFRWGLDRTMKILPALRVSAAEFGSVYELYRNVRVENAAPRYARSGRLTETKLDQIVRELCGKPQHWNERLYEDLAMVVEAYLEHELISEDFYPTLLYLYEALPRLNETIETFFCGMIDDLGSLRHYEKAIRNCPDLRQGVLSRIYQTEGCYQAAIDFEFEKFLAEWPKGANRQQDLAAVWELLARLKSMNAALVTREAAASGTGRYLEQVLLGGRMRQTVSGMKGELEFCLEQIQSLRLPGAYTAWLGKISDQYIRELGDIGLLDNKEIELLNLWPGELKSGQTGGSLHREMALRETGERIQKSGLSAVRRILNEYRKEQGGFISEEDGEKLIEFSFKRAQTCAFEKGKQAEKERSFDSMVLELAAAFPNQRNLIFDRVMEAPLGGVTALSQLGGKLQREKGGDWAATREDLRRSVLEFFETHEAGRLDKKAMKQEKEFLKRIGISYENWRKGGMEG